MGARWCLALNPATEPIDKVAEACSNVIRGKLNAASYDRRMCGMKRLITILFFFSVIVLLLGGCAYYDPLGYDPSYHPDNYGFIAPYSY